VTLNARVGADGKASRVEVKGTMDAALVSCVTRSMERAKLIPAMLCVTDERVASAWSYELTSAADGQTHDNVLALASAAGKTPR
jgi:hypothetical protein